MVSILHSFLGLSLVNGKSEGNSRLNSLEVCVPRRAQGLLLHPYTFTKFRVISAMRFYEANPRLLKLSSLFSLLPLSSKTTNGLGRQGQDRIQEGVHISMVSSFTSEGHGVCCSCHYIRIPPWDFGIGIVNMPLLGLAFQMKEISKFLKEKTQEPLSIHFWKETRSHSHLHFHCLKCGMAVSHHVDEWQIKLVEEDRTCYLMELMTHPLLAPAQEQLHATST